MKIFKSQKPAVCGTAKRPIRRWLLPPKKQQAYRFYSTAHFHVYERCRHFDADNKGTFIDESRGLAFSPSREE